MAKIIKISFIIAILIVLSGCSLFEEEKELLEIEVPEIIGFEFDRKEIEKDFTYFYFDTNESILDASLYAEKWALEAGFIKVDTRNQIVRYEHEDYTNRMETTLTTNIHKDEYELLLIIEHPNTR